MKTLCASLLGEFTKANGRVRKCRVIGRSKGDLIVQYSERGQTLVCYIRPDEFRAHTNTKNETL